MFVCHFCASVIAYGQVCQDRRAVSSETPVFFAGMLRGGKPKPGEGTKEQPKPPSIHPFIQPLWMVTCPLSRKKRVRTDSHKGAEGRNAHSSLSRHKVDTKPRAFHPLCFTITPPALRAERWFAGFHWIWNQCTKYSQALTGVMLN